MRSGKLDVAGIYYNYYDGLPPDMTVFETNRMWSAKLHGINCLLSSARVIYCVRSLVWTIDTTERIVQ